MNRRGDIRFTLSVKFNSGSSLFCRIFSSVAALSRGAKSPGWLLHHHGRVLDDQVVVITTAEIAVEHEGTGDEHDTVWLGEQQFDFFTMLRTQAQPVEREALLPEQSQTDGFAFNTWNARDTDINRLPVGLQMNAAVLRQAFLGDV